MLDRLATAPAFAGCGEAVLRWVARNGIEVDRRAGAVLQRPGRLTRQVLIVLEGTAVEHLADGRVRPLAPGDVVGVPARPGRGSGRHAAAPVGHEVVARSDVRVLVLGPAEREVLAERLRAPRRVAAAPAPSRSRAPGWRVAAGWAAPA